MASIQETLRAALGSDAALAELVGDRIYPVEVPEEETPTPWLYYELRTTPYDTLDDEDLDVFGEVVFHAMADTYAEAKRITDAVHAVCEGFTGGRITGCFFSSSDQELTEEGHHHTARYDVFGTVPTTAPPELLSATVAADGKTLTLVFSKEVAGSTTFEIEGEIGPSTASPSSGELDTTLTFTLSRTLSVGEVCTLDYTPGNYTDELRRTLAPIEEFPVTNNSATYTPPDQLTGLDLWASSAYGTYSDAGGTTPAVTNGAVQSWRTRNGNAYLLGLNSYGGNFFGAPTLRNDNGYPVVDSRTIAGNPAALTIDLGAGQWTPTNISFHWLARTRPGNTETYQIAVGMNVSTGMRAAAIWDNGAPLLANGGPNVDSYSAWCADGDYHLVSYVRQGGTSRIYLDGVKTFEGADATAISMIDTYWLLGFRVGDVPSTQYLADGWIYRAAHTAKEVSALASWCRANRALIYPNIGAPSVFVYFLGNSIWTVSYTSFPSVPTRVSTGQTEWARWLNASLGGQATGGGGTSHGVGMIARLDTEYGPILAGRPEATKVAVIFEITNDMALASATPAEAYAHYVTLADGLRARGASKVIAVTCLPRPQISEVNRDAVNALIVADAEGAFDAVCQIHTNATIGLAGTNVPPNYYADGIHLTSAGADVFAPVLRATIESVLP